LAETFFPLRRHPHPRLLSVGAPANGPYVTGKGFLGQQAHQRWRRCYGATTIAPPERDSRCYWPKARRRWLANIRQIVETVFEKLHNSFHLNRERPHDLSGFQARLAAKMVLNNFCV
jgi:hypothetical protein